MKQLLILKPVDLFEKCILKPASRREPLEEPAPSVVAVSEKQPESIIEEPIKEEPKSIKEETIMAMIEEDTPNKSSDYLEEFDIQVNSIESDEKLFLKKRDDVYYKMYREALKKARVAKELALTIYLEAKHIKNTYMLTDLSDESDLDEDPDMEN